MALQPGTTLGPYKIESAIGAGGMGEVYKATDARLNRTVAVKVLPPHFAHDADMKQRFEREAQTIAGLNHPHICTLHDVGEQDGTRFLVMEYVEGETLADRLSRGPLSIDEALQVGGEIVDALDRAHRQGIVHRDLKPANIMLAGSSTTRSGQTVRSGSPQTKLLDFGLAKWAVSDQDAPLAAQPTRLDVTAQGTMVGTLQYMAPEQVEGREADARTDIFAFGAVLYEMLTGRKAFEGRSQASLIGAIMKAEPRPISHAQPLTPGVLEHIVARCLVKDPDERWQHAHTLKHKLQWIVRNRGAATAVVEAQPRSRFDLAVTTVIVVLLAALSVPAYLSWRGPADPEAVQFRHTITGLSETDVAISPDGRTIAFVAKPDGSGASSLYTRPARGLTSVKLAGTANAAQPFWSPDSQFIGYVSAGKLKKVPASGGAPKDVCDAKDASGGAWSASQGGTIVFGSPKGLMAVSAEGGAATPVTELAQGETGHFWPAFLPDGRHLVYLAWSEDAATRTLFAGTLDSKARTKLVAVESNPVYAASGGSRRAAAGYLFFHRKATLFAQPFDAKALRFSGDPVQVAGDVSGGAEGRGNFSVSQNGVLLYFQGIAGATSGGRGRTTNSQFGWVDRAGGRSGAALDAGFYGDMDLSPDGKLVAITKQEQGAPAADIWVIDWEKAIPHRLTNDPGNAINPVWSPDGARIAFTSFRKGNADVYVKNANGVGEDTPLLESPMNESVEDWSRDGKYIAFEFGKDTFQDIYALPLEAGKAGKPFPVVRGPYQKDEPQFSKDVKWLAYASDENEPGRFQVYVISFPAGDVKQQISTDGGGQPRWSWDGKQIHYRTLDNRFMSVDLKLGATIEHAVPRAMSGATTNNPTAGDATRHMWSIASDGRILLRVPPGSGAVGGGAVAPVLSPQFTPAGRGGTAAAAARGLASSGLTAILHWTSALPNAGK
jgi:serine/threonine protein kinase/Tol biopolymer transport system component